MAERRPVTDRQLAVAILLSAAALAITLISQRAATPSELAKALTAVPPGAGLPGELAVPVATGAPPAARSLSSPVADASAADAVPASQAAVWAPQPPAVATPPPRALIPGVPRQLLTKGCCPGAWWSADSRELRFIDRPAGAGGAAIYGAPVWPPASPTLAVDLRLNLAGSARYQVNAFADSALIQDTETGRQWSLPTGGGRVLLSPDGSRAVWWNARFDSEHFDSLVSIHSSDVEGHDAKELLALWGADVVAFHPDNRRLLISGRPWRGQARQIIALLDTVTGDVEMLAAAGWISSAALSTTGEWVAYMVSLDREHPEANGVWLVSVESGQLRKLPLDGAYRWRDGSRLVYVPMQPGRGSHEIWQFDAATGEAVRLIDPAETAIRIADNDWSVSPDGNTLAFVAEDDRNIWLTDLP